MGDEDRVAGVDGCRGGWIIATTSGVRVSAQLEVAGVTHMGVDMPIGLSDSKPRVCDIEARKFLGRGGGSSVFPAPPRAILGRVDYRTALDIARSTTGRGISKQTFNITAKVAELDCLIRSGTDCEIVEVHPECSFRMLNSGEPLPSKKTAAGQEVRRHLLGAHFDVPSSAPRGAASDDVLDAFAVLWSTIRFRSGVHREFGDGQLDDCGIPMRIVC